MGRTGLSTTATGGARRSPGTALLASARLRRLTCIPDRAWRTALRTAAGAGSTRCAALRTATASGGARCAALRTAAAAGRTLAGVRHPAGVALLTAGRLRPALCGLSAWLAALPPARLSILLAAGLPARRPGSLAGR